MATTYTQTVEVSVWKEHACAGCGTVYRYLFKRRMKGQGGSPEAAARAAEKVVTHALKNEVDMQPCPGCGLYQPDMIASRRRRRHWWAFWAGAPVYGLLLVLLLTDVLSYGATALLAGLAALPLLLAHLLIDLDNPNRDPEANRRLGRRREKAGDIWVPDDSPEPEESEAPIGTGVGAGHAVCYLLLGAAALAFFLPWGLRLALGMRGNPGWYPEVAGPGDSAYVYFNDSVTSVKGLWNGQPRVTVVNAGELGPGGPVAVAATSNNDNWGNSISVSSKESKTKSPTLWARVQLPADPRLAGQTLQLRIDMNVSYPALTGDKSWQPQTKAASHTTTLRLSSAGSGTLYKLSFWLGFLGGCGLVFLAGGLLPGFSSGFRKKALPTRIFVPEDPRRRDEAEDEEDDRPRQRVRRAEDEDERPRRRRTREEEDEEDDRPRRRRDES
jgi:hypothetical protein